MEMEPSSLLRSMDVDLGAGLGDDLGGFEGFDDLFAHQSTTSDFFKFCALDEAEQDATVMAVPAPLSPGSSGASLGPFVSMGFGFAQQESCRLAQQSQTQNWENTLPLLATDPTTTTLAHVRGKPRGRKRLEEDEALEAEEVACPSIKRRSSAASVMKTEERASPMPVPPRITHAASSGRLSDRPHSFEATPAAAAWGTAVAVQGSNPATPPVVSCGELPIADAARVTQAPLPRGAIKVKKDVTSGLTRPRISVFMSSAQRGSKKTPSSSSSPSPSSGSLVAGGGGTAGAAATTTAAATPTSFDYLFPPKVELTMTHPASSTQAQQQQQQQQRLRDMKIAVRARTQAEKYVVETNPAVVAMGSRHTSSGMALDEAFAVPTLQRATSVGALTIAGGGELMSKSPVLSSSGRILQACELSDQVGDGGRRRNLVCKVFGSGSPFSRTSNGGLGR